MEDKYDPRGIVILQKASYCEFQRLLHDLDESDIENDRDLPSRYYVEIRKTSWSTLISCPLDCQKTSEQYIYRPDKRMDYLLYTYFLETVPSAKVHPDFVGSVEICWCNNLMHNIVREGEMQFGDLPGPRLNNKWLDIYAQFFMKFEAGKMDMYEYMIGNLSVLTDWSSELPAWKIAGPQPWFYSEHESHAIPLFLCSMSKVSHRYKFNLRIRDLLRMRTREEINDGNGEKRYGEWNYVKCDTTLLDKVRDDTELPSPIMWGRYANISDSERDWHKTWPHEMLATDVINFSTPNSSMSGSKVPMPVLSHTPITALYWLAEHCQAREINNHSNYTTDPIDHRKGWNPIKSISHRYNNKVAFVQDEIQSSMIEPWYHANSAPRATGYGLYSHAYKPGELAADVGIVYSQNFNGMLTFSIDSINPLEDFYDREVLSEDERRKRALQKTFRKTDVNSQFNHNFTSNKNKDQFTIDLFALTYNIITFSHNEPVQINDGSVSEPNLNNYQDRNNSNTPEHSN